MRKERGRKKGQKRRKINENYEKRKGELSKEATLYKNESRTSRRI